MKTRIITLFMVLLMNTCLWAYDFKFGDLYYNITSSVEPYTVEVTHQKYYSSSNYSGLTTATIPETVTYNGTIYSVTKIGGWAFNSCSSLTFVTIPNSVTSIGYFAFEGCSSLTIPVYNANVFAYMPTSFEGAYSIPDGIKQIAGGAFYDCDGLTSVTIPASVVSLEEYSFYEASNIQAVYLKSITPPIINGGKIFITSRPTCYIPCGTLDAYQASKWANLMSKFIEEECEEDNTSTNLDNTHDPSPMTNSQKIIRDGHFIILRDGKIYNVMGQEM